MRQDVYRAALDEANAELKEIVNKFEELRLRKEQLEKMTTALKTVAKVDQSAAAPERPLQFVVS